MASPQTQNGYARLANELVEALYRFPFSGCELRVLVWVVRHSYGWGRKDTTKILLIDAARDLRMPDASASWALRGLHKRNILLQVEGRGGWRLNKNYEEWLPTDQNQLGLIGPQRKVKPAPKMDPPHPRKASAAAAHTHDHCGRCGSDKGPLKPWRRGDGTLTTICAKGCPYRGSTPLTRAAIPAATREMDAARNERFLAEHRRRIAAKDKTK